jgi:hypothetical protein
MAARKRSKTQPWYRDPLVLERLEQHLQLRCAGVPPARIMQHQGIASSAYFLDERRIRQQMLARIGQPFGRGGDTMRIVSPSRFHRLLPGQLFPPPDDHIQLATTRQTPELGA